MKNHIFSIFCILICVLAVSCADGIGSDTDASSIANDTSSVAYKNANITHSIEGQIADDDEYILSKSDDGEYYHRTYCTVISSSEEWSLVSSNVGLEYDEDFFDESSLIVVEVVGASTTDIEGMTDVKVKDSALIPVIRINKIIDSNETTDIVCWYVTAEVAKADIEGYELGALEVEWNIREE
ncbi:MAG: hypothetical protein LUE25_07600 [Clostridiales bacterium]|nr:hypothetical protein [Clostridiales bacterium]